MLDAQLGYMYARKRTEDGMSSTRNGAWRRAGRAIRALATRRGR